jgi:hypothetical protein
VSDANERAKTSEIANDLAMSSNPPPWLSNSLTDRSLAVAALYRHIGRYRWP